MDHPLNSEGAIADLLMTLTDPDLLMTLTDPDHHSLPLEEIDRIYGLPQDEFFEVMIEEARKASLAMYTAGNLPHFVDEDPYLSDLAPQDRIKLDDFMAKIITRMSAEDASGLIIGLRRAAGCPRELLISTPRDLKPLIHDLVSEFKLPKEISQELKEALLTRDRDRVFQTLVSVTSKKGDEGWRQTTELN